MRVIEMGIRDGQRVPEACRRLGIDGQGGEHDAAENPPIRQAKKSRGWAQEGGVRCVNCCHGVGVLCTRPLRIRESALSAVDRVRAPLSYAGIPKGNGHPRLVSVATVPFWHSSAPLRVI